jgi:hypothetical protein
MLGLLSAFLIFLSLALPWFSTTFDLNIGNILGFPINATFHIGLSIYFFGFIGTTNGVPSVEAFPLWSNGLFFTLLLVGGIIAIYGSLIAGEKHKWVMVLGGTLALVCTPLYYVALVSSLSSAYLPGTQGTGGVGGISMPQNLLNGSVFGGTNVQVGPSFFWLPIVAAVVAFISAKYGTMGKSKESPQPPEHYPYPRRYQ